MKKVTDITQDTKALRRHAEQQVDAGTANDSPRLMDPQRMLHELQVHQIELEVQNEELRQAREETEEALQRYTELYDFAPLGYLSLDPKGVIRQLNLYAARIFGIERGKLIGSHFAQFLLPGDLNTLNTFLQRIYAGHDDSGEVSLQGHDKTTRVIRITAQGITAGEECRAALIDITASRQINDALRQSEAKFAAVFRYSPVGIAISRISDDCFLDVNDAFLQLIGCQRHEVIGHNASELEIWVDQEQRHRALQALKLSGNISNQLIKFQRKSGDVGYGLSSLVLLRIADEDCTLCATVDISDRIRMEQIIHERDEAYRAAIETSTDGFLVVNREGIIVESNDAYAHLSGYSRDELSGLPLTQLEATRDDERPRHDIDKLISAGAMMFDTYHRAKDGSIWPVEVTTTYRNIRGGRLFIFVRDVSEKHRLALESRKQRTAMHQLSTQQVAAQTAMAFAHELNQPLGAISAYSEAAQLMLVAGTIKPERLEHALTGIAEQAQRAGHTLHELINLLQSGETAFESLDINTLIQEAITIARHDACGLFYPELNLENELPLVRGNRIQLQKVMVNLLCNGVEAMQQAGIPKNDIIISVTTQADTGMVQVSVQDSGPGIDNETLTRIFTPFFTTKENGVGLGLSISRSLIESNGGQLWVDTQPGQGATFHFTLPFAS